MIRRTGVAIAPIVAAVLAAIFVHSARPEDEAARLISKLAVATRRLPYRPVTARLGQPFEYASRPEREINGTGGGTDFVLRVRRIQHEAGDSARVAGLTRLLLGDSQGAIAPLDRACTSGDRAACVDLSAAHLASAEAGHSILHFVDALVATDRVLNLDGNDDAALFNRARALDGLGLAREARLTWLAVAISSRGTAWEAEALRAAAGLPSHTGSWDDERGKLETAVSLRQPSVILRIVSTFPEDARRAGESQYSTAWAEAVLAGNQKRARHDLAVAAAIGDALQIRNGDHLLADATRTISEVRDERARAKLATAYRTYKEGRLAHGNDDPLKAEALLTRAAGELRRSGSAMALTAEYYAASASFASGRVGEARTRLVALRRELARTSRYRSLEASTGWELGLCLLAEGQVSPALEVLRQSLDTFTALGEIRTQAALEAFVASAYEVIGDAERAWDHRRRALPELSRSRRRSATVATAVNGFIQRRDWARAASLATVGIEIAERSGDRVAAMTGILQRARINAYRGERRLATNDLTIVENRRGHPEVRALLPRIAADVAFVRGLLLRDTRPLASAAMFERTARFYEDTGLTIFAPEARLECARSFAAGGALARAASAVAAGLSIMDRQRETIRDLQERALTLTTGQELYDEGVRIAMRRGDGRQAFGLAERGRARAVLEMFSGEAGHDALSLAQIQEALAPDAAILEYAVAGQDVYAFVVTRFALVATRLPVRANAMSRLIPPPIARHEHDPRVVPALGEAHARLVGPFRTHLTHIKRLAIIPDGAIGAVPFAALIDSTTGKTMIEQFAIVQAPSATLAIRCSQRARRRALAGILAAGATTFDRDRFELDPIPMAAHEARDVAALYGRSILLTAGDVTLRRLQEEARDATAIHFAGHAIRLTESAGSALLVAPEKHADSLLTTSAIAAMRLDRTLFVFVSACRSGVATPRRDGIESIATAFLSAGVPTVVATLDDVIDAGARHSAVAFHREYLRGGDAAGSLQRVAMRDPFRTQAFAATTMVFGGSRDLVISAP